MQQIAVLQYAFQNGGRISKKDGVPQQFLKEWWRPVMPGADEALRKRAAIDWVVSSLGKVLIQRQYHSTLSADELVKAARDGDIAADEFIRMKAKRDIETGAPLEDPIRGYVCALLDPASQPKPKRGKRKRGPLPNTDLKLWIIYAVDGVTRFGFDATRNRERSKKTAESACSIVAIALNRLGVLNERGKPFSERGVEGIWEQGLPSVL